MVESTEGKKWLIFQTFSGKEKKALSAAQKVIKEHGLEGVVEPILPTEFISKPVKKGKGSKKEIIRINVEKPIYRGYLFVGVDGGKEVIDKVVNLLTETRLMRALTKRDEKTGEIIYAFLSDREVNELKQRIEVEKQKREQKIPFIEGERVRILMGNFEGLVGTVEEIYPEKRKIKVSVNLLSRVTPLIIDFDGVEKAD
ncbi:MAG: transcription termination/antitermination NusG family protein [candidate division WOR-3 bacterium]